MSILRVTIEYEKRKKLFTYKFKLKIMKIIKLTQSNDKPIFVNMCLVREFFISTSGDSTTIIFEENHISYVKETPEEILTLS